MAIRNTVEARIVGTFVDRITPKAQKAWKSVKKDLKKIGKVGVAAFTGVAGVLAASSHQAAAFENEMAQVATLMDNVSHEEMRLMGNQVQDVRVRYGQLREDATKALFDITSAGFQGAKAMGVLESASNLAVAGVSSVAETSDIITSALNAYNKEAKEAASVSDILFKTQKLGKTTISELAQFMPQLFATAQLTSTGLEELGGVIATLTSRGLATNTAVTATNALLLALASPGAEAAKTMKELGIRTKDAQGNFLSLTDIVGQLKDLDVETLTKIVPSAEAIKAVATLTANYDTLKSNIEQVSDSQGAANAGFEKMSGTVTFMAGQLGQGFQTMLESMGTVINEHPRLRAFFSSLVKSVGGWSQSITKNRTEIEGLIGLMVNEIAAAWNIVTNAFKGSQSEMRETVRILGTGLVGGLRAAIGLFRVLGSVISGFIKIGGGLGIVAAKIVIAIESIPRRLASVPGRFRGIVNQIKSGLASINPFTDEKSPASPKPEASKAVGMARVPRDMTVRVHKDEAILNPAQARKHRSGGGNFSFGDIVIQGGGADAGRQVRQSILNELRKLQDQGLNFVRGF